MIQQIAYDASMKMHFLGAIHRWCSERGEVPYMNVVVSDQVQVPMAYVKNGRITLNVGYEATTSLMFGDDVVTFTARFNGKPFNIYVPVNAIEAIYSRESDLGVSWSLDAEEEMVAQVAQKRSDPVTACEPVPIPQPVQKRAIAAQPEQATAAPAVAPGEVIRQRGHLTLIQGGKPH